MIKRILLLTIASFTIVTQVNAATKFESQETFNGVNSNYDIYWGGQTFTATSNHSITQVSLKICRQGTVTTEYVSLRATDGGLPTGPDLTTGSANISSVTTNCDTPDIINFNLTEYNLSSSTTYALIWHSDGTDASNRARIAVYTPDIFSGGTNLYSNDSGVTWGNQGDDYYFEIWGNVSTSTPPGESTTTQASTTDLLIKNADIYPQIFFYAIIIFLLGFWVTLKA